MRDYKGERLTRVVRWGRGGGDADPCHHDKVSFFACRWVQVGAPSTDAVGVITY